MSPPYRTTLEHKIQAAGSPVELAPNFLIGPYVYPKVPAEFTNWRDEQIAWRDTAALFDQSHHMADLYIEGPDAVRLLADLGVNSLWRGLFVAGGGQSEKVAKYKSKRYVLQNDLL
jgi:glycine cleavage system aminomethyltransferase T